MGFLAARRCALALFFGIFFFGSLIPRIAAADDVFAFGPGQTPGLLTVGAGTIGNVSADRETAAVFSIEYRTGPRIELLRIRPSLGFFVTTDSSLYGWFGLSTDLIFWRKLVLTPQIAVGAYNQGDGEDLGGTLEFRSGVVLAWRFDNESRLGVGVHHLSNAGIGDRNPGTESLAVFYSHPLTIF